MTDRWTVDPARLLQFDPLGIPLDDAITDSSRPVPRSALSRRPRGRWPALTIPVALLLLLGMGLGPHGVNLLSLSVLEYLDPAMPVALAALGALVGLAIGARSVGDQRWLAIAGVEPLVTVAAVASGTMLASTAMVAAPASPPWTLALFVGVCAAMSLGMPTGNPPASDTPTARITEFEAALLIVGGGLLLVSMRKGSLLPTISLAGEACTVVVVLASAGRLLLTQASSETEQRVITLATLMLVGGVSDYLSLSPLLGGLVAGVLWQVAGGPAREWMRRDALYVLHPFLVALLLVVGARVELSTASLGLAAGAYAVLRCCGKVVSGVVIRRFAGRRLPPDFGRQLVRPGVFGVALALDALRAIGPGMSMLATVIVLGTILSELLAGLLDRREATA